MGKAATLLLLLTFIACLILIFKYSSEEGSIKLVTGEDVRKEKGVSQRQQQQNAVVNTMKEEEDEPELQEDTEEEEEEEEFEDEEEEEVEEEGDEFVEEPRKDPVFEEGQDELNKIRKSGVAHDLASANIDAMSLEDLLLTMHSYLDNIDVICARKLRMGKVGDGGWEICDDPEIRPKAPCIIYSFGIKWDFSFDDDAARLYRCHVYSFDPSMDLKTSNRSELIHFYKLGIHGSDTFIQETWKVSTLETIRAMLGHQNKTIDVLKMDVESSEWPAIPNMIATNQLKDVKQFLVEFHVGNSGKWTLTQRLKAIQAIEKEGFRRFYVHKNHACRIGPGTFPISRTKCYEIHYIRR